MAHVHPQERISRVHSSGATRNPFDGSSYFPSTIETDSAVEALDLTVSWGDYVVSTAHHQPPRTVTVGEAQSDGRPCDVLLPQERLGFDNLPVIEVEGQEVWVLVPATAEGFLKAASGAMVALERLRLESPAHGLIPGARRVRLHHLDTMELRLGVFHLVIVASARIERPKRSLAERVDSRFLGTLALTVLAFGAWFGSLAYYVPDLNLADDSDLSDEQLQTIRHFLNATAERNLEQPPTENGDASTPGERAGRSGSQSRGEAGKTGNPVARQARGRMSIQGSADNRDVHLGKSELIELARNFGIIDLIGAMNQKQPQTLSSPFGQNLAVGHDAVTAIGQLYGESIGDSAGFGGLSLSGTGIGGGCVGPHCGAGIGITGIGTIGGGTGTCADGEPCDGMGRSGGLSRGRGHVNKAPRVRMPPTLSISGRLPPEVIQRIVRQNYGRFRFCYEKGLATNPNLEGRVVTRFVIGRDGAVSNAQNGGSDLPDAAVQSCILQSFYGLSFPAPEGGIVSVTYPIQLQPG